MATSAQDRYIPLTGGYTRGAWVEDMQTKERTWFRNVKQAQQYAAAWNLQEKKRQRENADEHP